MSEFASKTFFVFDPSASLFDCSSVADDVYITPSVMRDSLADLSRLSFVRGALFVKVVLDSPGDVVLRVRLTDGVTDYASVDVEVDASVEGFSSSPFVDLSGINGGSMLGVAVDVVSGDAVSASVVAKLAVEAPLIISR